MEALLLLIAFPAIWPFIAKRIWHTDINLTEMVIQWVGITVISAGVWQAGIYGQTSDTEVWNGQVTNKTREHGHYLESYDCNCTTTTNKDGTTSRHCQTCYEDHYTVTWNGMSNVGNWVFQHLDRTSKSVYRSPDPGNYTACVVGEPAAREHTYTNYVQAVPESIFHDSSPDTMYANQIPAYPRVYGHYKINRVLQAGTAYKHAAVLNEELNNILKRLGPSKQANIVVILTSINDPKYRAAVERKWLGGEKNDITIFVGLDKDNNILWSDVMTWALNKGNADFRLKLARGIKELGDLNDPKYFISIVDNSIKKGYDRPEMKDFEYLKDAVEPPTWVIILAVFMAIGGSLIATFVFIKYEVEDVIGNAFRGNRRNRNRRRW